MFGSCVEDLKVGYGRFRPRENPHFWQHRPEVGHPALVDGRPEYFSHLLSCIIATCLAQKRSKHSSSTECSCATFSSILLHSCLSHFGDRVRRWPSEFSSGFSSGAGYLYCGAGSSEHDGPAWDQGAAS